MKELYKVGLTYEQIMYCLASIRMVRKSLLNSDPRLLEMIDAEQKLESILISINHKNKR